MLARKKNQKNTKKAMDRHRTISKMQTCLKPIQKTHKNEQPKEITKKQVFELTIHNVVVHSFPY